MSWIILLAIPFFIGTMVLEALWARRARARGAAIRGYERRDTATSLAMGLGMLGIDTVAKLGVVALWFWLYEHRLFDPGTGALAWVALFFAEDFCYYWAHRTSHEVRLFWAAHVNHHSSQHYNLSTALRQSWTTPLTFPIFWLPLPLLGFAPWMIIVQKSISLLYQYWLHTEAIDKLPRAFELVFNTPSQHRVHHGRNPEYLDRNHAGILSIWDRLFGTFEPERAPVDYGLTKNLETFNPVRVAFHEWRAMFRDAAAAPSFRAALGYVFGPPGWRHDGTGSTSAAARAAARSSAASAAPYSQG